MAGNLKTVATLFGMTCFVVVQFASLDAMVACPENLEVACPDTVYACPEIQSGVAPTNECTCDNNCPTSGSKCCPRCGANACVAPAPIAQQPVCPTPPPGTATSCLADCSTNVPCKTSGEICCDYGCGRRCMAPV